MILNCQSRDAEVIFDILYEDREPDEGITLTVPARRAECVRMDITQSNLAYIGLMGFAG